MTLVWCGIPSNQSKHLKEFPGLIEIVPSTIIPPRKLRFSGEFMEQEFKYEWQKPVQEAILDRRRLLQIEIVIRQKLRSRSDGESPEERLALVDALDTISVLRLES